MAAPNAAEVTQFAMKGDVAVTATLVAPRLFDGERWHENCAVSFANGLIIRVGGPAGVDAASSLDVLPPGTILAPGFVDLQVNGGGGVLLNDQPDAASVRTIIAAHRGFGTTGLLPTLITDVPEKLCQLAAAGPDIARIPGVLGLHLEGPFLNPRRKGIHPEAAVRAPRDDDVAAIFAIARQLPVLVTLAPECVPAGFIAELVAKGVRVAIGHSEATAVQVTAALDEGATAVTHLFNAMSQMTPREPGVVGTALDDRRIISGIICDGVHVASANLRTAFRAVGRERLALVTDAMPSVGSASATFMLQGRSITLQEARLTDSDGTLAGAHLSMIGAVRNAVALLGASLADALVMASLTPARLLGMEHERGFIKPGYAADFTAFTGDFEMRGTWVAGSGLQQKSGPH